MGLNLRIINADIPFITQAFDVDVGFDVGCVLESDGVLQCWGNSFTSTSARTRPETRTSPRPAIGRISSASRANLHQQHINILNSHLYSLTSILPASDRRNVAILKP